MQVQRSAGAQLDQVLDQAEEAGRLGKQTKLSGLKIQKVPTAPPPTVPPPLQSHTVKQLMGQARAVKGLTQQALATLINLKAAVVNQYEKGEAIPNHTVLNKLEATLGAKLR